MKKCLQNILFLIFLNFSFCSLAIDAEHELEFDENYIENYSDREDEFLELQTGIPKSILLKLCTLSYNIPISIRSKKHPNYRFSEPFDSKPSAIHQKTSNRPPVSGHVTELDQFTRILADSTSGLDLTDHSFGAPPKQKKLLTKDIRKKYHPSTFTDAISIFSVNGRIFYGKIIPRFKKPDLATIINAIKQKSIIKLQDASQEIAEYKNYNSIINYKDKYFIRDPLEPFAKKYFIQETECIQSILENINKEEYIIENFLGGILKFKSRSFPLVSFQVDFNKLIEIKPESDAWKYSMDEFQQFDLENSAMKKNIPEILKFISEKNQNLTLDILLFKYVTIDTIIIKGSETIIKPLMVQVGNSGNPITGDFDLMDVYLPVHLPEISFVAINTYTDDHKGFIEKVKILRDILTLSPAEKKELLLKNKVFAELPKEYIDTDYTDPVKKPIYQVFQCLAKYTNKNGHKKDPMAKYLKNNWVAVQGKMHIGAYLLNCAMNITIGKNMFNHGTESFNPVNSDDFGVLDHFYKGKIFHIETEKECLDFYFHDEEYLTTTFTRVHPYFLRERPLLSAEKDLPQYWLDLIKVQILNGHISKMGDQEKIKTDYNKYAPGKGDEIVEFSKKTSKLSQFEKEKQKMLIYKTHKRKCTSIFCSDLAH